MDGEEEPQDVYFDLTSTKLVNVGHLFETDQTFFSRRDLKAFVRDIGKKNNICIAVLSSKGGEGKGLGNAVVYLGCERSLNYRKNKAKGSAPKVNNNLNSGTKRCNCPFRLKGKEISTAAWRLFVINGNHNHNFPTYNVGRSIISRLSEDEKIKAKELSRAHVGLAFLQDEKKGSFEWALQCTKDLFNPNQIPEVIVTDREFALIHAIGAIFPNSYHMLCTRHIAKNVEARAKKVTRSTVFSHAFVGNWNRIVYAETEAEYEEKLQHFQKIFASHPNLVTYVQDTWLIHATKFVHAYTNKVQMGTLTNKNLCMILIALDPIQMGTLTYLPLYVPEGISSPEKLICIAFLRSYNHFVSVPMINNCPLPEINTFWYKFREDSVHGWDAL